MDAPGVIVVDLATEADVPAMLALSNGAARATPANFATEPETLPDWLDSWRMTSPLSVCMEKSIGAA
jgi:hypothetical protein